MSELGFVLLGFMVVGVFAWCLGFVHGLNNECRNWLFMKRK